MTALSKVKDALLLYVFVYVRLTCSPASSGSPQCRLPVGFPDKPPEHPQHDPNQRAKLGLSPSGSNSSIWFVCTVKHCRWFWSDYRKLQLALNTNEAKRPKRQSPFVPGETRSLTLHLPVSSIS